MKRILNEWRKFLKEAKTGGILQSISKQDPTLKINDPRVTAIFVLYALRGNDSAEVVKHIENNSKKVLEIFDRKNFGSNDLLKIATVREQNFLAGKTKDAYALIPEFDYDMEVRTYPDMLTLRQYLGDFISMVKKGPASYNFRALEADIGTGGTGRSMEYRGSGGATDTGIVVPNEAKDEEKAPIAANINKYKSYYMYKPEDYIISSQDYEESLNYLVAAYEGLYHLWMEHSPADSEFEKVKTALRAAVDAREIGIEMSDEEKANQFMKTGNKLMAAGMKEAAMQFRSAKALYKKLGMSDKAREAQKLFQKSRMLAQKDRSV